MPGLELRTCTAHSAAHNFCFRTPLWTGDKKLLDLIRSRLADITSADGRPLRQEEEERDRVQAQLAAASITTGNGLLGTGRTRQGTLPKQLLARSVMQAAAAAAAEGASSQTKPQSRKSVASVPAARRASTSEIRADGVGFVNRHGIPPPSDPPPRSFVRFEDTFPDGWGQPQTPAAALSHAIGITTTSGIDGAANIQTVLPQYATHMRPTRQLPEATMAPLRAQSSCGPKPPDLSAGLRDSDIQANGRNDSELAAVAQETQASAQAAALAATGQRTRSTSVYDRLGESRHGSGVVPLSRAERAQADAFVASGLGVRDRSTSLHDAFGERRGEGMVVTPRAQRITETNESAPGAHGSVAPRSMGTTTAPHASRQSDLKDVREIHPSCLTLQSLGTNDGSDSRQSPVDTVTLHQSSLASEPPERKPEQEPTRESETEPQKEPQTHLETELVVDATHAHASRGSSRTTEELVQSMDASDAQNSQSTPIDDKEALARSSRQVRHPV